MAGWRRAVELAMTDEEIERLTALSRSRTEPASRVSRAQMLLAYRENPSFCAVEQRVGVHHQTVQRCVERALGYGPLAAIEDRPRPGKEPVITPEAKAWLVSLACDKAKEHGYPRRRICRPSPASTPPLRGITSTNAMARSACWPGSICSPERSTRSSEIATAAANSSNSSSFSMPPIRPAPRSS